MRAPAATERPGHFCADPLAGTALLIVPRHIPGELLRWLAKRGTSMSSEQMFADVSRCTRRLDAGRIRTGPRRPGAVASPEPPAGLAHVAAVSDRRALLPALLSLAG